MPKKCPACGSNRINQFGTGTEKVENELQKLYPEARLLRWDADTASGKGAEEIIMTHFRQHNADVLIGTQMLAKGLGPTAGHAGGCGAGGCRSQLSGLPHGRTRISNL